MKQNQQLPERQLVETLISGALSGDLTSRALRRLGNELLGSRSEVIGWAASVLVRFDDHGYLCDHFPGYVDLEILVAIQHYVRRGAESIEYEDLVESQMDSRDHAKCDLLKRLHSVASTCPTVLDSMIRHRLLRAILYHSLATKGQLRRYIRLIQGESVELTSPEQAFVRLCHVTPSPIYPFQKSRFHLNEIVALLEMIEEEVRKGSVEGQV